MHSQYQYIGDTKAAPDRLALFFDSHRHEPLR
jgi:hypothetical protein